ncbi:MAG: carbohydrate ABC transporter permease [Clostridiaceae bacterium]|nr:carbohydrate ABC transporter permease [Clostridiaceae bacterium]
MDSFKQADRGDKIFYIFVFLLLTVFFLLVLYPVIFVLSASFSSGAAVQSGKVLLLPVEPNIQGYKIVFNTPSIWRGFANSLFYTVSATLAGVSMTMITAYGMSRRDLPGRNAIMMYFVFTMFFSGGMITSFLLIQSLGLINTRLAMIIPGMLSVYNMIIARTFIQNSIPEDVLEASKIDGCSDIGYFFRIVLPLSKAIMAVLVLFIGVYHWNAYFNAMLYLHEKKLYPITLALKEILLSSQIDPATVQDPELQAQIAKSADIIKYALIVVSMVPILIIYPSIQKYFVKGVMIGSVKG